LGDDVTYNITVVKKDGDTHRFKVTGEVFSLLSDVILEHRQSGYMDGWSKATNCYGEATIVETGVTE
jgi:hypothetical protein